MDLIPYVARLQRDLVVAADPGDEHARELAERLAAALEPAVRLALLDALVEAAAEVTADLGPSTVEVRLRGHEVGFAVAPSDATAAPAPPPAAVAATTTATGEVIEEDADGDDGATVRLSLRMPERLKPRVERAADADGLSVNAWLVRAVASVLDGSARPAATPTTVAGGGQRHTGWVR